MGQRQHFLIGAEMRARHVDGDQFLSPYFNSTEIHIVSTKLNRTIQSAYSQFLGLYPEGPVLIGDQADYANAAYEVEGQVDVKAALGSNALFNGFNPIPIHGLEGHLGE